MPRAFSFCVAGARCCAPFAAPGRPRSTASNASKSEKDGRAEDRIYISRKPDAQGKSTLT